MHKNCQFLKKNDCYRKMLGSAGSALLCMGCLRLQGAGATLAAVLRRLAAVTSPEHGFRVRAQEPWCMDLGAPWHVGLP